MAIGKAIHTRILADGYLISSETNKASIKMDGSKIDVTPFEATAQQFIVGDPKPSIEIGGYITHSTNPDTFDAIAHGALENQITVAVIKSETATMTGGVGYVLPSANAISLSHDLPVDGVMTINATWGGAVAMRRGLVPYAGVAISATGTKPSVDLGAQGTVGGQAYLFVTTITGSATNATIKVQSAATEGGSYADEGTFTFSAIGCYALALTGAVDRWIRINTTSLGGATSFVVHCIVCVQGVTQ